MPTETQKSTHLATAAAAKAGKAASPADMATPAEQPNSDPLHPPEAPEKAPHHQGKRPQGRPRRTPDIPLQTDRPVPGQAAKQGENPGAPTVSSLMTTPALPSVIPNKNSTEEKRIDEIKVNSGMRFLHADPSGTDWS
jgi:hypothetical protein